MRMLRTRAKAGATTKLSPSATKRIHMFRNGARTACGVRLSPAASMLLTRKTNNATFAAIRAATVTLKPLASHSRAAHLVAHQIDGGKPITRLGSNGPALTSHGTRSDGEPSRKT